MSEERVIMPLFLSNSANMNSNTLENKFHHLDQIEKERCHQAIKNSNDPFSMSIAINRTSMNYNRYSNIIPFNYNRIRLLQQRPNKTDYINASYIEAPNNVRKYIVTQGPLKETIDDFWLMIWEQNTRIIVMLTNQIEKEEIKCETYWPKETGYHEMFKDIGLKITLESEILDSKASCYVRILKLEKLREKNMIKESRQITQLQTIAWPDHGVPDSPDPINNLIIKTNEYMQHDNRNIGPIVVHCSAGCGRTGTFCTVDSTLALLPGLQQNDSTDLIYNVVQHFRQQRISMVQNLAQYQFCYLAVLSKLVSDCED
ncbi:6266_t:CDS:1 [Funneliformis geosporum]|uniref:13651_t:CDS:1 n=1 Tax=Funneliformis geosporum TaxID=1117311 RepID=A0A9W4WUW4_9GLOM|nr:6266_t:CDS:1 [Funneliformis geosporum]CAI2187625.1 13651_t:CDS:1 [Funneliformis geosporum]